MPSLGDNAVLLPDVPPDQLDAPVAVWREPVMFPTYLPQTPDRYPAYLDHRVYQGSSGRVYPLPFHDRIAQTPVEHQWDAVHIENRWLRVMVLPELGGRIHLARDKRTGHDLFYFNPVIKPALVGLAGPWIAGGVEFNWPQHHRPGTFLPMTSNIHIEPDGAAIVWCCDHDPFARMKGMHGIRLTPDRSTIELRVRLYNRSEERQTFMWWSNVAAKTHNDYQAFFPTDVHVVADHAKRSVATFPAATDHYYGVDYPSRRGNDRAVDSDLVVPGDRIDWYRNIPVPTSYMCVGSDQDFFGGYDHRADAGFVHWADHHYSVGKKLWTWGNAAFGHAWDHNLADDGSSYVELMAGVYTDNQPDFSFIDPGETKVFSQYWYPLSGTGPVQQATRDLAASLTLQESDHRHVRLAINATRVLPNTEVTIRTTDGTQIFTDRMDLAPDDAAITIIPVSDRIASTELELLIGPEQHPLLHLAPASAPDGADAAPAREPSDPSEIETVDELYLTGVHLEQYRHPTRSPEPYWSEALRRDPGHVNTNTGLGHRRYRQGLFTAAEQHLRTAIERLTMLNPNPADSEPYYLLGLTLIRLGRDADAYAALAKATWNRAWCGSGNYQLARIDARHGRDTDALQRVDEALRAEPGHLQARDLKIILLGRLGHPDAATNLLDDTITLDGLDAWTSDLQTRADRTDRTSRSKGQNWTDYCDAQMITDVALEYAHVGASRRALQLLETAIDRDRYRSLGQTAGTVMGHYHRARVLDELGLSQQSQDARTAAREADPTWNFPWRLDDGWALHAAITADCEDGRAHGLLGQWLYAHDRRTDALTSWRRSTDLDGTDPVIWRDIALASVNHHDDEQTALDCYDRALRLAPSDAKLWYERDQLLERMGKPVEHRLALLEEAPDMIAERDDLAVAFAQLLVDTGQAERSLDLLEGRTFQPWEGGEGAVLAAWERTQLTLAAQRMSDGDPHTAVAHVRAAIDSPVNLGEARHPLANPARLLLTLADALAAADQPTRAVEAWTSATEAVGDFSEMAPRSYSQNTFFSILAAHRLGGSADDIAAALTAGLREHCACLEQNPARVDYFATSLPSLLFSDDPQPRQELNIAVLRSQLLILNGDAEEANERLSAVLRRDPANRMARDLQCRISGHADDSNSRLSWRTV